MSRQDLTTSIKRINAEIVQLKREFAWELTFDRDLQRELANKRNKYNALVNQYQMQYAA
jgi:hypothetical protein